MAASQVHKRYGATAALDGADLTVLPGEIHGLVGANGAGKSTLVKALSGAVDPDSGELSLGDWRGRRLNPRQAHELGLATIYQDASLVGSLGLVENVMLGRESGAGMFLHPRRDRAACTAVLEMVGLPTDAGVLAGSLTSAQQQLLEIAKALHREARVIIMDEPTAALGAQESERLFAVVRDLRGRGVAVVFISHRLDDVVAICDRVTVMRDGRDVATFAAGSLDEGALVRAMIGHDLERAAHQSRVAGEPVLQLRGVAQGRRLRDVSFTLHAGEVLGITGLVGSGRSRLARVVFGCESVDGGEMTLLGRPYRPASPRDAIARGVGLAPEDRKRDALLMEQTSAKNITLAKMPVGRGGLVRLGRERTLAGELMRRLRVKPSVPGALPASMSGGNQQKVSIARWIHAGARVLILDEPSQGVDIAAREQIFAVIADLVATGCGVIVISQEVEELQQIADRVLVMRRGQIAGELAATEINEHRVIELAMGASAHHVAQGAWT
ncbi:sugar ABC transporter ATP-binding protein [Baekduia alba]|uniref:sugar ABC transporter ATP-binding protein n=1 Tax=Baekduia alba TaxID=2997333 RepID=UPI00233FCD20|nr:sugar ABC transporter ATP-binding protein [Baekduia alba]